MLKHYLSLVVVIAQFCMVDAVAEETAENLFNQYRSALYQIQMIDNESGNKTSIGSGFRISAQGDIVTNYHVVSEYVYSPDKYRIEFLNSLGDKGELTLQNFDVVNDLALLKIDMQSPPGLSFELAQALPYQGAAIYSLGNPHDLGMIVVPGTYNGLKKNSFYQRIHFTGSINPGMSGGPAVNSLGQVVGVNVATAGNQIGFLIPLPKIKALFATRNNLPQDTYKQRLQQQLLDNQAQVVSEIVSHEWQVSNLGRAQIPEKMALFISCWGGSNASEKETQFLSVQNRCRLGERIYLNSKLQTGEIEIEYEWIETEKLNSHRFYQFFSDSIGSARPGNQAGKNDVSNYQCQHDLIKNTHDVKQKSVLCVRAYKDFDQLFDVLYIAASIDFEQSGLISHFTLSGVSKASAQQFTQHFMDAIAWQ